MNRPMVIGVLVIEAIFLLVLFGRGGVDETTLSIGLRATALVSFALFSCAFSASAINRLSNRLWRGVLGKWLMRNRRSLGVSFALSHLVHLGLIVTRATVFHDAFFAARTPQSLIPGGITYVLIVALLVTSFDGPARWLGRARWKVLHKVGVYVIFALFASALAARARDQTSALVCLLVLLGVLGLRAVARLQALRKKRPGARASRRG